MLLGLAMPATASAVSPNAITPSITEYTAGMPAGSSPHGMALGDDGNVWFADHGIPTAEAIGFVTPAGAITRYTAGISNNVGVQDVAQGPGGIWFSELNAKQMGIVTPAGAVTEMSGPKDKPAGIAAGPDGAVWFAEDSGSNAIGQITVVGGVTEFSAGLSGGSDPEDIATGPDGNLWFTEPGKQQIGRITPFGVITEYGTGISGDPQEIAVGPDGNLWFTQTSPSAIGRITPLGAVTEFTVGLPGGSAPQAITAGSDGNVYFTDNGANAVGQVTPAGAINEFSSGITANADLKGIATGSDGALWFAEHIGAIGRMTVGPTAQAATAHGIDATSVKLKADVSTGGAVATFAFDYGTTTAYGQQVAATVAGASGKSTATITGLTPATTYHARAVVTTGTGVAHGADITFTTLPADQSDDDDEHGGHDHDTGPGTPGSVSSPADSKPAADTPAPASHTGAAPAPEFGSSVVGGAVEGTVLVTDPATGSTWRMDGSDRVPRGSIVDARRGRVSIVSALDAKGHTQQGTFWSGRFRVGLPRAGHGMVELRLLGMPQGCGSTAARAARKRSEPVRLWGKDHGGRYRTIGNSSVATVRGTEWLVEETCAGTVTRVVEGAVSVWDRGLHKRILLTAGPRAAAHVARFAR